MIRVSKHAIARYQERVASVGNGEARRRILLHERVLTIASDFGAPCVRDACGVGYLLKGGMVTTVLGPTMRLGPIA